MLDRLPTLSPHNRRWWDFAVLAVIVVSAFEVPYSAMLGWEDTRITLTFEWIYFLVFGTDVLLNLCTPQLGSTATSQPEVAQRYMRSRWFIIDLISAAPLYLVIHATTGLPALRTLRLISAARMLRVLKGMRILQRINTLLFQHPSLGRFITLALVVPWLVHAHAVMLAWAESGVAEPVIQSYGQALHWVYIALVTQDPPPATSTVAYLTWISSTLLALVVVSTVIGNMASLMFSLDDNRREFEQRLTVWNRLFREQPLVFDANLQHEIVAFEHRRAVHQRDGGLGKETLLHDLPAELELEIRERMRAGDED
jgi:hypothetical protein